MEAEQSAEEQILLTVADQSKLDLVMELLSHFDLVRAERIQAQAAPAASAAEPEKLTPEQKAQAFLGLAGIWADRDVDARTLRERAWRRGNSGN